MVARVVFRKEFTGYWEYILEEAIYTSPPYANFAGTALIGHDGRLLGIGSLFTQSVIPEFSVIPCNVFIPIDLLNTILHDLITNGRSSKAPRPWLDMNSEESHGRVFINRVTTGGPTERAGLQPGDLILTVKGTAVNGLVDFYRKVWALGNAGVDVPLSILRETRIRDLTILSTDRYQFLMLKPKSDLPLQTLAGRHADRVRHAALFQRAIDLGFGKGGVSTKRHLLALRLLALDLRHQ
jgi:membrane-associated protease RseP (regulator of RpoE activity)